MAVIVFEEQAIRYVRAMFRSFHWLRPLIVLLAFCEVSSLAAQIGVKVFQFRPTAELGDVMGRKVSAELMYIEDFEARIRPRAFLTYLKLEPRLDAFPVTGYEYRDGQWTVFPGTQSYSKFNIILFGGGFDWAVVKFAKERFVIYPGGDILAGAVNEAYEHHVPGLSDESFSGGHFLGGFRGRLGIDCSLSDHVGMFAEYATSVYWAAEQGRFTFNDVGLGVRYNF